MKTDVRFAVRQMLLATAVAAIALGAAGCGNRSSSLDDGKRDYEIAITAQGEDRILVFDPAVRSVLSRERAD